MFSLDTINFIKGIVKIEDVVRRYINLKKSGQYLVACCPFHHERTASFFVSTKYGFYKCFGCGEAGDAIDFIKKYEHVDFVEAIKLLAKIYNVQIQEENEKKEYSNEEYKKKEKAYVIFSFLQEYYKNNLKQTKEIKVLNYIKKRGLTEKEIDDFSLGYSPEEISVWLKISKDQCFDFSFQKEIGILGESYGVYFDRLQSRLTFSLQDINGAFVGFAGRQFCEEFLSEEKQKTKYINPPESFIYHKSKNLYGIFQAKKYIREKKKCYLVEGFFDVISMHKYGFKNTVGSLGTSLTDEQCILLKHLTDNITIIYDTDNAGEKATVRATEKLLSFGFMVNVLRLKGYKDPDEFVKNKTFEEIDVFFRDNEIDFVSFFVKINLTDKNNLVEKNRVGHEMMRIISLIKDDLYKKICLQKLSQIFGVDFSFLDKNFNVFKKKEYKKNEVFNIIEQYEYEILRILLKYGEEKDEDNIYAKNICEEIKDICFQNEQYRKIKDICENLVKTNSFSVKNLFEKIDDDSLKKIVINMLLKKHEISNLWKDKNQFTIKEEETWMKKTIYKDILSLKLRIVQKVISQKIEKLKECEKNEDERNYLLDEIKNLKENAKNFAKKLNIIII